MLLYNIQILIDKRERESKINTLTHSYTHIRTHTYMHTHTHPHTYIEHSHLHLTHSYSQTQLTHKHTYTHITHAHMSTLTHNSNILTYQVTHTYTIGLLTLTKFLKKSLTLVQKSVNAFCKVHVVTYCNQKTLRERD